MEYEGYAGGKRYMGICGISFHVYRIVGTGSTVAGIERYKGNQQIYTCTNGSNTCVIECILIARDFEEYRECKGRSRNIISKIRSQYYDLFGETLPKDFDGVEIMETLQMAADKYSLKFVIYIRDDSNDRFEQFAIIGDPSIKKENSLLLIGYQDENKTERQHLMYIKSMESLEKIHVCPKCFYMPPASQHGCYNKERFETHVKNCDGSIHKELKLNKISKPYAPFLQKNHVKAFLKAHDRENEYKYITDCIAFDFETMREVVDKEFGSRSCCYDFLRPLTLGWTVKNCSNIYSNSLYIDDKSTEKFINEWINLMF
jgi:hypothetical protein